MALQRLKPKTGQIGLYLLLLAIIVGLMGLMRWLPEKTARPAQRPFTVAMVILPEVAQTDSTGLKGPGIQLVERLESLRNIKIRIMPVADRAAALQALTAGSADIAGPALQLPADTSAAFSDAALWKEFSVAGKVAAQHPAAMRSQSDTITLPLKWAVRRSDTALLRTVNSLLD